MAQFDLVSLADVKSWLSITTNDATRDAALSRTITQISRAIYNYMNRGTILPQTITEYYSGGRDRIQLRNWPVISIVQVTADELEIPESVSLRSSGYWLEPAEIGSPGSMQILQFRGYFPLQMRSNIRVTYTTGYLHAETWVIPTTPTFSVMMPYGKWASSYSVSRSDGTSLTEVASSPAIGEYTVQDGVYTFSAVDSGQQVIIQYGFIPADLASVATEWIAYRWSSKDRIGQTSKSIGGQETVSYTNEAIPAFVAQSLQNFRRVVPC